LSANTACTLRTTVGELVVRSKQALPFWNPLSRPCSPSATDSISSGPGREVNTISVASATLRGESAQTAPAWMWGAAASRLRSWTTSSCPDFWRFDAMLLPMMPSPMNPTFIVISYFLPSKTCVAMRAAVMAVGQPE